jgi:F0F1-type ATP synthase membrane subunit b/b'
MMSVDAEFFKSLAFFCVVIAMCYPLFRYFIETMQRKSQKIASHFYEAKNLLAEAENLLKEAQEKNFYLHKEEKELLEKAYKSAHHMEKEAEELRQKHLAFREKEIEGRVKLVQESGLKDLRKYVISFAVDSVKDNVSFEKGEQKPFFDEALEELKSVLKTPKERKKLCSEK